MKDEKHAPSLLFLVGYRGTGKTTVARALAAKLGWESIDADERLEARFGRTIRQIFAEQGEAGFRDKEAEVLEELCRLQRHVIATGGGVVLRPANRQRLSQAGTVVWLAADVDTICQRIAADRTTAARRPALTVGGRAEVEELLRQREPLYREVALFRVDTSRSSPQELAEEIGMRIGAPAGPV